MYLKNKKVNFKKFFFNNWFVVLIILFAAFLRFWNLAELMHWTFDEEVYFFHLKRIVVDHKIPLIGVSAAPLGMELGPWFYWTMAIPFFIGGKNPLFMAGVASFLGVITCGLVYLIALKNFNKRVAILSTLIYSSSFLIVFLDKHFWSVTPQIFIAFLVLLSLVNIAKRKLKYLIVLALTLGFAINSDLLSIVYFPVVLITFWFFKINPLKKVVFVSICLFLLMQLPLVAFDLRHNFHNTQALTKFLTNTNKEFSISTTGIIDSLAVLPKFTSRMLYVNGERDYSRESTYCPVEISYRDNNIPKLMYVLVGQLFLYFIYKTSRSWKDKNQILIKLMFWQVIITTISLIVYGVIFKKSLFEFYMISLIPPIIYTLALFINEFFERRKVYIGVLIISAYVLINSFTVLTAKHNFGYQIKIEMVSWALSKVNGQPYSLHSVGDCHQYEGHRYLTYYLGHEPEKSYVDPQLAWLFSSPPAQKHPELGIVFVSLAKEDQEAVYKQLPLYTKEVLDRKRFKDTEVLIIKNKFND